jgi:hypothetical protein
MTMTETTLTGERADLLDALTKHRGLFLHTLAGLTDEQAAATPTVSELCLGGLVKHVTRVQSRWLDFITGGPAAIAMDEDSYVDHANSFRMLDGVTLAVIVESFEAVSARTDEMVRTVDLDLAHPLPEAPWFPPGTSWSARRVFVHVVAEMTQHSGHADILREHLDGQKSMG